MNADWILPTFEGAACDRIGAVMTTRKGGISVHPFDTMNVGIRVGDDGSAVDMNRQELATSMGTTPVFLKQVHGAQVVRLTARHAGKMPLADDFIEGDASFTTEPGVACVVQVADCLPVLLASHDARVVGAAHAGWRGLAAGVLERTVQAMAEAASVAPRDIQAWLGPCIGPASFEVGQDVLDALATQTTAASCFVEAPRADGAMRWRADLPALAALRLKSVGVERIVASGACTVTEPLRYFSYRRDKDTGRHAAAIWIRA